MKRVFELIGVMLLAAGLALAQTTALPEPPDPPDPSEPAAADTRAHRRRRDALRLHNHLRVSRGEV